MSLVVIVSIVDTDSAATDKTRRDVQLAYDEKANDWVATELDGSNRTTRGNSMETALQALFILKKPK